MTQPILTIEGASEGADQAKASVNLLPCRVHHDGEVGAIDTYWNPAVSKGQWSAGVNLAVTLLAWAGDYCIILLHELPLTLIQMAHKTLPTSAAANYTARPSNYQKGTTARWRADRRQRRTTAGRRTERR